jgi:hypothetical protein
LYLARGEESGSELDDWLQAHLWFSVGGSRVQSRRSGGLDDALRVAG